MITILSTQDERIAEEFRALKLGRKLKGQIVEIDGDVPVGMRMPLHEFAQAISSRLWERVGRANWRPFALAREFIQTQGLISFNEWRQFCKSDRRPRDIPTSPLDVYRGIGWQSWGDWLGTGRIAPYKRQFLPFEEARVFAQSLNLKSRKEWTDFSKSGKLPANVPFKPDRTYAEEGWSGVGDWLGTERIANFLRVYRPFEEARAFAQSLGLKTHAEWVGFSKSGKLPKDIPAAPQQTYREAGWSGYGDWLGTRRSRLRQYRDFEAARKYARTLGLKSQAQWRQFAKTERFPLDIRLNVEKIYRDRGWVDWADWLGENALQYGERKFSPFENARAYVRSLAIKNQKAWRSLCKSGQLPRDIPLAPELFYRGKGWVSLGDWLGTGVVSNQLRTFRSFEQAKTFARSLKLGSRNEWRRFIKSKSLPADIPADPEAVYREKGWVSMGDWLGTGTISNRVRQYRPFTKARAFVRRQRLKTFRSWVHFVKSGKLPDDIPSNPNLTYREKGWLGWIDWLGTR